MLVKEYIKGATSFKKELAEKKSLVNLKTQESKRRSELFLEDEIRSTIRSLHGVFTTGVKKLTDNVADQRTNLYTQIQKFTNKTQLIHELLESTNPVTKIEIDILSSYHTLRKLFLQLMKRLNQEKLQSWRSSVYQSSMIMNQSWINIPFKVNF